ncbi:MAG: T9SS type A sorting domain-containing protein [Saprospiraceae bacterium]|nr:T9SS type A sorting domain-containing protein [Saprospiraceae bacterium]
MKYSSVVLILFFIHVSVMAQWTQIASPPEDFRTDHSFAFAIRDTGYIVAGKTSSELRADFYRYLPGQDEWTQLPDFPGGTRGFGIGEVWEDIAYFGFGAGMHPDSTEEVQKNDLWAFDPSTNEWTELSSCPCSPRIHPAFITHKGNIYVGLGSSSGIGNLNDWWVYNIATDTWAQKADLPSHPRHHPYQFAIGDYVYAGFGHGSVEPKIYDTWYQYDPEMNSWTEVASMPGQGRVAGTQFSHNGFGYVLSGDGEDHDSMETGEFWRYNADSNQWNELPPHPGSSRWAPASFIINNEVYLINGPSFGDYQVESYKYDLGDPTTGTVVLEDQNLHLEIYPNPFSSDLTIQWKMAPTLPLDPLIVKVMDAQGRQILESNLDSDSHVLLLGWIPAGQYFLELQSGNQLLATRKILKTNN